MLAGIISSREDYVVTVILPLRDAFQMPMQPAAHLADDSYVFTRSI